MIKVLKAATNLAEMLFICEEYNVLPILNESLYLGLNVGAALYEEFPEAKIALFDSDNLLEIVSYDNEQELLPYMKEKQFKIGYKVSDEGSGTPIQV